MLNTDFKEDIMKKKISLFLATTLIFSSFMVPTLASDGIKVLVDNETVEFDVPPQIINGRTMVPMRSIFEKLGAKVEWDGLNKAIHAKKDNKLIVMHIGKNNMDIDGNSISLDTPATIVDGRTLVPVRAVAESFNCDVDWDNDSKTVKISQSTDVSSDKDTKPNEVKPSTEAKDEPVASEVIKEEAKPKNDEYIYTMTSAEINKALLSGAVSPNAYSNKYSKYYIRPVTFDELGLLLSKSSKAFVATPKHIIADTSYGYTDLETGVTGMTLDEAKEIYNMMSQDKYLGISLNIAYPSHEKNPDITIKVSQDSKEVGAYISPLSEDGWPEWNYVYSWEDLKGYKMGKRYNVGYKFSPMILIPQESIDTNKDVIIEVSYNKTDMFEETDYMAKAKLIFNKGPIKMRYTVNFSKFE